ncbi:MAG TPA: hypothetical protein VGR13_06590 [Actinomycetota bacterium]|nr:hypothetical protein [Actinomycetota bacterium]
MRAAFYRLDAPDAVVGSAVWRAGQVEVEADDETVRQAIRRIFRPTPVVIDDPSMRSYGTSGPVVLSPGPLGWFRAAGEARSQAEGLGVRFVPEAHGAMGWDPAGAYRTFNDAVERAARIG